MHQKYGILPTPNTLFPEIEANILDGTIPRIPEIRQWTDCDTKQQLLVLFAEMDEAAFKRWRTGKEYPENCTAVNLVHWTKTDGGRYQEMEDGWTWKEYDANNKEIRCLDCVWMNFAKLEVNLREEGTLNRIRIKGTRCEVDTKTDKENVGFWGYEEFVEYGAFNFQGEEYWKR